MDKIIEYGDVPKGGMAKRTRLAGAMGTSGLHYSLMHSTAGYECAGSMARLTVEKWGCIYTEHTGTTGGNWYLEEAKARAQYEKATGQAVGV